MSEYLKKITISNTTGEAVIEIPQGVSQETIGIYPFNGIENNSSWITNKIPLTYKPGHRVFALNEGIFYEVLDDNSIRPISYFPYAVASNGNSPSEDVIFRRRNTLYRAHIGQPYYLEEFVFYSTSAALTTQVDGIPELASRVSTLEAFVKQFIAINDDKTYGIKNGKPELIAEVGEAVVTVDTTSAATLDMRPEDMPKIPIEIANDVELITDNDDEKED